MLHQGTNRTSIKHIHHKKVVMRMEGNLPQFLCQRLVLSIDVDGKAFIAGLEPPEIRVLKRIADLGLGYYIPWSIIHGLGQEARQW